MEQKRNTFKQLFFVKKQRVNQKGEIDCIIEFKAHSDMNNIGQWAK